LISGLESDGRGLASALDDLLSSDRGAFDAIERELCLALPSVRGIKLAKRRVEVWKKTNPHQQGRFEEGGKEIIFRILDGIEIPASELSDGAILLLGYLVLLSMPDQPRILLLEEPENGVHPSQLSRVARHLTSLAGRAGRQVVITTHSPYLLDFVPPESVLVMGRRANGDTFAAPLLSIPSARARLDGGFSLGELWFNVGEDALLEEAERGHEASAGK
jgi:predicted ATPase